MTPALWQVAASVGICLICAGVGAALMWGMRGDTIDVLRRELERARNAEALATDRLVHAWKEGAQIPPRPMEPGPPLQPLPADLQAEVEQWEDPVHRAEIEAEIRMMLGRGLSPVAVLMALDNNHPA